MGIEMEMAKTGSNSISISVKELKCWKDSKKGLAYNFEAGHAYVIIGQNGIGKTTLLEIIAGVKQPYSGQIYVGEQLLGEKKWYRYKWNAEAIKHLAVALQHAETGWLGSTVKEECELVLHAYYRKDKEMQSRYGEAWKQERIDQYLTLFGLNHLPLETEIQLLSVGQQKRLSIATAMMCELPWLLLDEPSAGLDHEGQACLSQAIMQHKRNGGGVIMISHQLKSLVDVVDYVIELNVQELIEKPVKEWHQGAIAPDEHRYAMLMQQQANDLPRIQESGNRNVRTPDSKMILLKQYFDPRFILLTILMSSTTILVWNSWLTLFIYSLLSMIGLIVYRHKWNAWQGMIVSFIIISIIFAVVGGMEWRLLHYDMEKGLQILLRMSQFLVIIAISLPVMELMTPFRLQRALEQSFGWLEKLRVPIYSYTLLISLIFRMIPLLAQQWDQMSKLARVRMKLSSFVSITALSKLMIAYIRAILIVADRLATSLELRGFQSARRIEARGLRIVVRKQDYMLLTAAATVIVLVALIQAYV